MLRVADTMLRVADGQSVIVHVRSAERHTDVFTNPLHAEVLRSAPELCGELVTIALICLFPQCMVGVFGWLEGGGEGSEKVLTGIHDSSKLTTPAWYSEVKCRG